MNFKFPILLAITADYYLYPLLPAGGRTLNRGEKYRFYGIENPEYKSKIVVTIYNNMKRDFQVATTYNKTTKTKYEAIEFKSGTTGTFCIAFTFLDGDEGCGVGIASFRKE